MRRPPANTPCHARSWLIPAALLALAPKCLLCVATYAGLGAALGLLGPEICGAADSAPSHPVWLDLLALTGPIALLTGLLVTRPTRAQA